MKRIGILILALFTCLVSAAWPQGQFITFDAPKAGRGAGQGTQAYAISPLLEITGFYIDKKNVVHGFVRGLDGGIATFDAPNAGTGPGEGTVPQSINPLGVIAGFYFDKNCVEHGFLREPNGTLTEIHDAPGAGTTPLVPCPYINPFSNFFYPVQGTAAYNINLAGVIAGTYTDDQYVYHGFVRALDGTITGYEDPNASTFGTYAASVSGLNLEGAITGTYFDSTTMAHGYLRSPNGTTFTTIDAPWAATGPYPSGTVTDSINDSGTITGNYFDANGALHSFVRTADNNFTPIDVPGAGGGPPNAYGFQGTIAASINATGAITGNYVDSNNLSHGFVRAPKGMITPFDAPKAGTQAGQGTFPASNNPAGAITGYYIDSQNVSHGFLWIP